MEELISEDAVIRVIQDGSPGAFTKEAVRDYARAVCDPKNSFRKLFAILVLLRRGREIVNFVNAELSDRDLPLKAEPRNSSGNLIHMRRAADPQAPLKCFRNWYAVDHEDFDKWQWTMLSPFFGKSDRRRVRFYALSEKDVLPWTRVFDEGRQGGFSDVYRIAIHPNHHNFEESRVSFPTSTHTRLCALMRFNL